MQPALIEREWWNGDASERPAAPPCRKWKYVPSADIDARIHAAYLRQRNGDRTALKNAAAALGWPRYAVGKRAAELGLSRSKEEPWCHEEEDILTAFGHLTPSAVQRRLGQAGFTRSCGAITVKLTRMRIKRNLDGYSAHALARAFGVDVHRVLAWIRQGLLHAERRETARTAAQGGDTWWITQKNVKRFVFRAPDQVDLCRVEKFWFLDLITDGKICR